MYQCLPSVQLSALLGPQGRAPRELQSPLCLVPPRDLVCLARVWISGVLLDASVGFKGQVRRPLCSSSLPRPRRPSRSSCQPSSASACPQLPSGAGCAQDFRDCHCTPSGNPSLPTWTLPTRPPSLGLASTVSPKNVLFIFTAHLRPAQGLAYSRCSLTGP